MHDYGSFWGQGPAGRDLDRPERTAEFPLPMYRDEVEPKGDVLPPVPHEPKHQAPRRRRRWLLGVPWATAAAALGVMVVAWSTASDPARLSYPVPTVQPAPKPRPAATVTVRVQGPLRPGQTRTETRQVYVQTTVTKTAQPKPAATATVTVTTTTTTTVTAPPPPEAPAEATP